MLVLRWIWDVHIHNLYQVNSWTYNWLGLCPISLFFFCCTSYVFTPECCLSQTYNSVVHLTSWICLISFIWVLINCNLMHESLFLPFDLFWMFVCLEHEKLVIDWVFAQLGWGTTPFHLETQQHITDKQEWFM